jgi:hypothetical protein
MFCGGVGLARQMTNNIFDWRILALIMILVSILIFSKNAEGQSPELKNERLKTDSVQQGRAENQRLNDLDVTLYRIQPFLAVPSLRGITKSFFDKRGESKQFEIRDNEFWTNMNLKIDSAWREFDHRCRRRNKL